MERRRPAEWLTSKWRIAPGLLILAGCHFAGESIKGATGSVIPGSMLGLLLLLALLALGLVRLSWVEEASALLLWLLPLLLLPAFVGAAEDKIFWRERGAIVVGAALLSLLVLWGLIGHFAQWLFARTPEPADDPGPLTDLEQRRAACEAAEEDPAP